jgi:hypothetical protein
LILPPRRQPSSRARLVSMIAKPIAFLVGGAALIVALWMLFEPKHSDLHGSPGAMTEKVYAPAMTSVVAAATVPSMVSPSASSRVFELTIKKGRLVAGPAVLRAHEGERITVHIASDSNDELHLHGYDLRTPTKPDSIASLQLTANRTGRFGLELHKAHAEIGALEVYPQ